MSNIFFTADHHFNHKNIIRFCNRPFKTLKEMDEALIDNWNSVVEPEDIVYHLGDFSFSDPQRYLQRLNGRIHLIFGNHDRSARKYVREKRKPAFQSANELLTIKIYPFESGFTIDKSKKTGNGQDVILSHYAMWVWNKCHYGSIHLFGHSHGNLDTLELLNRKAVLEHIKIIETSVKCGSIDVAIEFLQKLKEMPPTTGGDHHKTNARLAMDIGVDTKIANYYPIPYSKIKEIMDKRAIKNKGRK